MTLEMIPTIRMKKNKLFSINVSIGTYADFLQTITSAAESGKSDYTCIANVHMLVEAYKSASFAQIVSEAAVITPDGKPLTWALRMLHGLKQERVAGMDLLPDLLLVAEKKNLPVFFYGGSGEMLQQTRHYLQAVYPHLVIAGMHSPPFRPLTSMEEEEMVKKINHSGAKLVFVVLGCPKQEKWMAGMKGRVHAFMLGVGGALPVLIGMQKRAPKWMQAGGLEWLFRLGQEPRRLFKRYAVTNTVFLYLFVKAYLRQKLLQLPH